ncbi:MAG: energy transducer TonB, partial [Candidatus Aminicenantes bacterium]|nr:energy transducer TonB [Candidatus Aminicenantes bacterium]
VPEVRPAPPPLRQPTPQKLPVFEKTAEPVVHTPPTAVLEMAERRAHAPAFTEFIPESKKKSSPAVFIAAAIVGVAALGYFLVLKPKGREAAQSVSTVQPPPVVSERASVENAPRFESQPEAKRTPKSQAGAAKPKPSPPPAIPPEPDTKTSALQAVIPAGEAKLEIQIPEQTALQATANPAAEQITPEAQRTTEAPATAPPAPAAPAKAETGQLVPLEEADSPPRIETRVEPTYPPIAFRMGIQGTVWINALVSERGNVLQAIFLRGTTAGGLDKAAETAVLKWKYQPAQKDGVNVKVWLPVRVDFVKRS